MQDSNTQLRSVHLNLPADSLEAIAGRPKVPHDLYTSVEDWQTRMLTILPGEDSAELRCELNIVDLVHSEGVIIHGTKHRLQYQALSYSWGYRPSTVCLRCNGQECQVSSSLEQALRAIRQSDGPVHVWVDAFCINQADLVEKGQQIQRLRLIFAKANMVAIWLGDSKTALQIKRLLALSRVQLEIGTKPTTLEDVLASCRWFRRSWVRQEVAAARHLVFIPQAAGLDFEHLCSSLEIENEIGDWHPPSSEPVRAQHIDHILLRLDSTAPCAPLLHMMKSRLTSSEPQNFSRWALGLLVKSCLTFQATDPKDKVYGVLGLLSPRSPAQVDTLEPLLNVDYNKSVAEIYVDMTMHVLLTSQHMGILELHTPATANPHRLPSWVFNFDSPTPHLLQSSSPFGTYERGYSRSTSAEGIRCYHTHGRTPGITPHSPVLVVHGYPIGKIRTVDRNPDLTYWRSATIDFCEKGNFYDHPEDNNRYQVNTLVQPGDTVVYLHGGNLFFALRPIASASDRTETSPYCSQHDHQYYEFLGAMSYAYGYDWPHTEDVISYTFANHNRAREEFHLV